MICALKHNRVGPNFRLRCSAADRKSADHGPVIAPHFDAVANLESGKLAGGANADDYFILTRLKTPTVDNFEFIAHLERLFFNAAQRHVCIRSGRTLWQIDNDKELRRSQR